MHDIKNFIRHCDRADEEWSMFWNVARRDGDALDLLLHFETHSEDVANTTWKIRVEHAREIVLMEDESGVHEDIAFSNDHVLLWKYKEPVSVLYFAGSAEKHESLLWDLYEQHGRVTKHWIPFDRYLNTNFIRNRLSGGHGALAKGPDRLLQEYATVLRGSDLEPYFPHPPRPPMRWVWSYGPEGRKGFGWEPEDADLSVLELYDSYVVGTGFTAEEV